VSDDLANIADYETFIQKVRKKYAPDKRDGGIVSLTNEPIAIDAVSTGSLQVDRLTGIGGFPRGRISEVFGPTGTGKTTIIYGAIRAAQHAGLRCAYFDVEQAIYPEWMASQGVDIADDKLLYSRAYVAESVLDLMDDLARSGHFGLIVIDSVAALIPAKEYDADSVGDQFMGGKGRLLGQALRRVSGSLADTNTALVVVNHLRDKLGVVYGESTYRPGGKGLDYACSLMLQTAKGDKVEDGKETVGFNIRVKVYKNRFRGFNKQDEALVRVYANGGISRAYDLLQVGLETGVLTKAGAWLKFRGENLANGEARAEELLESDDELAERLAAAIEEAG
jgi:recombination protein RecA